MRIQKFIAECGVCSRRAAEELVKNGLITVNGKSAEIGQDIDPESDRVSYGKKRLKLKSCDKQYFAFYKPRGVITSMKAQDDRSVVSELIRGIKGRVYPVGRLDRDSEGLLILTDDGNLAQRLSHPSHHVSKTYRVTVRGQVPSEKTDNLRMGVSLDDGTVTQPCDVEIHSQTEDKTVLYITLYEGKNRQIRRMCEVLGLDIMLLKRISVGDVSVGRMKPGEYRPLSHSEIEKLFKSVGLTAPAFKNKDKNERKEQKRIKSNKTYHEHRFENQMKKYARDIRKKR